MNPKAVTAVQSLSRIRIAETRSAEGLRRVWHQGNDVDLLSQVDGEGKLLRQELTLLGDYFLWTSTAGLRTGTVAGGEGSVVGHSTELVSLDARNSDDRLRAAQQALSEYRGEDRYVLHMRHVLEQMVNGLSSEGEVVITLTRDLNELVPPRRRAPLVWIGLGLLAVAIAAIILLVR